ncbi:hypothetical protein SXCC_02501 [Gluconacetobacter sp. SXCC-1]|nr:hypothetical protein SXCC_02501 [Gluconacetobacter sp. SXCC-1]
MAAPTHAGTTGAARVQIFTPRRRDAGGADIDRNSNDYCFYTAIIQSGACRS